jgi:hypothetical protein
MASSGDAPALSSDDCREDDELALMFVAVGFGNEVPAAVPLPGCAAVAYGSSEPFCIHSGPRLRLVAARLAAAAALNPPIASAALRTLCDLRDFSSAAYSPRSARHIATLRAFASLRAGRDLSAADAMAASASGTKSSLTLVRAALTLGPIAFPAFSTVGPSFEGSFRRTMPRFHRLQA